MAQSANELEENLPTLLPDSGQFLENHSPTPRQPCQASKARLNLTVVESFDEASKAELIVAVELVIAESSL